VYANAGSQIIFVEHSEDEMLTFNAICNQIAWRFQRLEQMSGLSTIFAKPRPESRADTTTVVPRFAQIFKPANLQLLLFSAPSASSAVKGFGCGYVALLCYPSNSSRFATIFPPPHNHKKLLAFLRDSVSPWWILVLVVTRKA
jgi:hypothetical protein